MSRKVHYPVSRSRYFTIYLTDSGDEIEVDPDGVTMLPEGINLWPCFVKRVVFPRPKGVKPYTPRHLPIGFH